LHGTLDYGQRYVSNGKWKLHGFTNADWAGCSYDRKRTSIIIFSLGFAMISCSIKKQTFFSLSTIEAEYVAACSAHCEVMWLQNLFLRLFD